MSADPSRWGPDIWRALEMAATKDDVESLENVAELQDFIKDEFGTKWKCPTTVLTQLDKKNETVSTKDEWQVEMCQCGTGKETLVSISSIDVAVKLERK